MKAIRLTVIFLILSSMLLACGCAANHPYPFDQSFDNIEKVMVGISDIVKNAEMIIQKLISDK